VIDPVPVVDADWAKAGLDRAPRVRAAAAMILIDIWVSPGQCLKLDDREKRSDRIGVQQLRVRNTAKTTKVICFDAQTRSRLLCG
jgi:hypothetical protein